MLTLTLRGVAAHKRRLASTVLAVFLGVAFMAGSLVFTDTMRASLSGALADAERGTDALVRGPATIEGFTGTQHAPVPDSLVEQVAAVPGVDQVAARVEGYAQVVGPDGKPLDDIGMGAAPAGMAWTDVASLNPFTLVSGRGPRAADEVVVDRSVADEMSLTPGDRTTVLTAAGPTEVEVVGVATFGDQDNRAGNRTVLFTLDTAQRLLGRVGHRRQHRRRRGSRCRTGRGRRPGPGRSRRLRRGGRDGRCAGGGEPQPEERGRRLLRDVHEGLRRGRPARRCVHHQQHLRDPHRPAHQGARAAARSGCDCSAGAPQRRGGGHGGRRRRVRPRTAGRGRRGTGHPVAVAQLRRHAARGTAGGLDLLAGHRVRGRRAGDRRLGDAAGTSRGEGRAAGADAIGRGGALASVPGPDRAGSAPHDGERRGGRAGAEQHHGACGDARCPGRLPRCRHTEPGAGPTRHPGPGRRAPPGRRDAWAAGAGERDAQPTTYGSHCLGADDRRRPGRSHHRLRGVGQVVGQPLVRQGVPRRPGRRDRRLDLRRCQPRAGDGASRPRTVCRSRCPGSSPRHRSATA